MAQNGPLYSGKPTKCENREAVFKGEQKSERCELNIAANSKAINSKYA
jgi:hypothetical protein